MELSIIYTHWAMNDERSRTMRESFYTLLDTVPNAEIIVIDNGGSYEDSCWFLKLTDLGYVASYTRYRDNMHFAYARNDGLKRTSKDYIAICDNDIRFEEGWAEECIEWLSKNPGKYFVTPIAPDPPIVTGKQQCSL